MDKKLYEASIQGDVASLRNLLDKDRPIIHRYIANPDHTETPLHIATLLGHVDFVRVILDRWPELAREVDADGSTALHLASATGHVEIIRRLLEDADEEMCNALDRNGMSPVHVAAVKGRVDGLREMMVAARPGAARMVTGDGLTVLHLCVKYNQLEAMKLLMEDGCVVDDDLVNSVDQEGNTILHLAVLDKQAQTVNYLLRRTSINTELRNVYGLTASDISKLYSNLITSPDERSSILSIKEELWKHECQSSARLISNCNSASNQNHTLQSSESSLLASLLREQEERRRQTSIRKREEQQAENRRNAIIIAATVIASMSFQVAANPPGGVWQDTSGSHVAGQAIMASVSPTSYKRLIVLNTVAFCGSAFVFLILLSRLPFLVNNKYVIGALNVALWMAILSSSICFTCSVIVTTPVVKMNVAFRAANAIMYIAFAMWGVIFIGHVGCFIWKRVKKSNASSQNSDPPRRA